MRITKVTVTKEYDEHCRLVKETTVTEYSEESNTVIGKPFPTGGFIASPMGDQQTWNQP